MFYLSFIRLAEADDTNSLRCFREAQDMQPSVQTTERDITRFAIFLPCVSLDVRILEIELGGEFKRQIAFADVPLVLARIESDVH